VFGTIYEFVRSGSGLALIVVGVALILEERRGTLRLPLGALYASVGSLFVLSALNPPWPDAASNGVVLVLVFAVSQSFFEIVLYMLGGERSPRHASRLFWIGAAWTVFLWAVPWLDDAMGWARTMTSVEDMRGLAPMHALSAAGTYAWPVAITVTALARGRWRVTDIPRHSRVVRAVLACCGVLVLALSVAGLALALDLQLLYRVAHLVLTAWMLACYWLLAWIPDVFEKVRRAIGAEHKRRLSIGSHEAAEIDRRLARLVAEQEIFRTEGLTIGTLARRVQIPPYRLSKHFSQHLRTTFPAWLNGLRIRYACDKLGAETQRTVLDIAMDAGYRSKAVFHHQFVRITGKSPGEFRRQLRSAPGTGPHRVRSSKVPP